MKKLAIALLVLVAGIAGFGLYRGWITVKARKIEDDADTAKNGLHNHKKKGKHKSSHLKSRGKVRK